MLPGPCIYLPRMIRNAKLAADQAARKTNWQRIEQQSEMWQARGATPGRGGGRGKKRGMYVVFRTGIEREEEAVSRENHLKLYSPLGRQVRLTLADGGNTDTQLQQLFITAKYLKEMSEE